MSPQLLLLFSGFLVASKAVPSTQSNRVNVAGRKTLKISLAQIQVSDDKNTNLERAKQAIKEAADSGSSLVILPESFNCPYKHDFLVNGAEFIPDGITSQTLSQCAKENNIFVAGSFPEITSDGQRFNTCPVFNPKGVMIAKHRKIFMAVTNAGDKMVFDESKVFNSGNQLTTFQLSKDGVSCLVGIGICRDVRYPEVGIAYRQLGAQLIIYPGAFTPGIGQDHYELLHRARALDSQLYVAAVCPARDDDASFVAYGNSMLLDPWGQIVCRADRNSTVLNAEIDLTYVDEVRKALPIAPPGILSLKHLGIVQP